MVTPTNRDEPSQVRPTTHRPTAIPPSAGQFAPFDTADELGSPEGESEEALVILDQRMHEALAAAQHAAYAAAAEVAYLLQRALRLTGEPLYQTAYTQALRTWWEQVGEQVSKQHLQADHALRRVRSWARTYLTAEIGSTQPGTLFDHALAHASRAAARRFLTATGELLAEHAARHDTTLATVTGLDGHSAAAAHGQTGSLRSTTPHHTSAT